MDHLGIPEKDNAVGSLWEERAVGLAAYEGNSPKKFAPQRALLSDGSQTG